MRLINLKLSNFKGIRDFELRANGKDVSIMGDNATGKTTIFDSFTWLLFGKDSLNRADFEIKTLGPDGQPEHGLEHAVEAILELDDRQQIALKKVFQEKWQKKRGSATAEFTGHTTDHFIDGVPAQKKEYDAKIAEIANEQVFRLLTDPRYFNEVLHWQKRRELLLEVCGDVSDSEVIASNPELSQLSEILGNRTIEQHRKVIQARRSEINKELEKIPVRIDEVQRNLPDISDIVKPDELSDKILMLRGELRAKQEELAQVKAGGKVADLTKELRTIEGQLLDLKNKHRKALDEKVAEKRSELSKVQIKLQDLRFSINSLNRSIEHSESEICKLNERIEALRSDWRNVNEQPFEFEQSETCPTCGQALPKEQLNAAREKALADFNQKKAARLESITAEGKQLASLKSSHEEELKTYRKTLEKYTADLVETEQEEALLKSEIDAILRGAEPVESTSEYILLQNQRNEIQEQIRHAQEDVGAAAAEVQKEIDKLSDDISALEQAAARLENRKQSLRRIEELKEQERKLAAEYEELEQQLYLTEEFIRTKVKLLEERINSKFRMARFKLFDVQVNGAISETCETTFNGVPYSNLNNGARLNIGLDIINTLSEHYGFAPVVFIDNAESVVNILPTKGQQIRLIVSGTDKKLRVELAERESLKEVV